MPNKITDPIAYVLKKKKLFCLKYPVIIRIKLITNDKPILPTRAESAFTFLTHKTTNGVKPAIT